MIDIYHLDGVNLYDANFPMKKVMKTLITQTIYANS